MTEYSFQDRRFEADQEELWLALHREFNRLKTNFGVKDYTIAEGLGLSRTPVKRFMDNPREGLSIHRNSLIRLYYYLTDPECIRNLPVAVQQKRKTLKDEGPNRLLEAVGFQPVSNTVISGVEPGRHPLVQRIASRLSTRLIQDADLERIANTVFDRVLDCLTDKNNEFFSGGKRQPYNLDDAKDWGNNIYDLNKIVKQRYKKALEGFYLLGKKSFYQEELFELVSNIRENFILENPDKKTLHVRIIECQFKTLSLSLEDQFYKDILKKGLDSELILKHQNISKASDLPPVIQAVVKCRLGEENKQNYVYWRFSSCHTHLINMLTAVQNGLGYPLELTGFNIRAVGKEPGMLARISVSLSDEEAQKTYYGIWIEKNSLIGASQAVVAAVKSWLSSQSFNLSTYYETCEALAEINENIYRGRETLHDYILQRSQTDSEFDSSPQIDPNSGEDHESEASQIGECANTYLESAIEEAEKLRDKFLLDSNRVLYNCYGVLLERQLYMAKWMRIRSVHIEGKLKSAKKLLEQEDSKKAIGNQYAPVSVLYTVEEMVYKFFSGNEDFINNKQWRNEPNILNNSLEKLQTYLEFNDFRSGNVGVPDFNVYLAASEVFGNVGRLDFYFSDREDIDSLESAIANLLNAAYFSSRIGLIQRMGHWTTHISRAYSRLQNQGGAKKFLKISERVVRQAIDPRYKSDYQNSILAEVNLASGELLLLTGDKSLALQSFIKSLQGAIYHGFIRLIADSLYGASIASQSLDFEGIKDAFILAYGRDIFKQETGNNLSNFLNPQQQGWRDNNMAKHIIDGVNSLVCELFLAKNIDNINVPERFKDLSKWLWHEWAKKDGRAIHPVEKLIDNGKFINQIEWGLKE